MAALRSRCGHYIFVLFRLFSFFFCSPNVSGLPYFDTWCGPSANLKCRSEMWYTRLAEIQDAKRTQKLAIWAPSHNFVGLYLRNWGIYWQPEKLLNSNTSSTYPHNIVNFGLTSGRDRLAGLGHPSKFQRGSRLGFVTAATSLNGSPSNFARCLPVCWACILCIHFLELLPLTKFSCKIHFASKSCILLYWQRLVRGTRIVSVGET